MPLPMSRRIELLRTKWFNLLIHSSRQMERLPIVNERIGLAWNGEQAIELPKEPQQEGSRLSHPCYELLMPIPHSCTLFDRAKKELTSPIDFLHHSFGHSLAQALSDNKSFFWRSLRHLDLESDR